MNRLIDRRIDKGIDRAKTGGCKQAKIKYRQ